MAQYIKKKFNVGLFLVLVCLAVVPGVIYGIYCATPVRVDKKPKLRGWKFTLICSGINLAIWIYNVVRGGINDAELPVYFIIGLICTALLFVATLFNKEVKKQSLLIFSYVLALFALLVGFLYFIYAGFWAIPALVAPIVCFVGLCIMQKYHTYFKYVGKEASAPQATEVEAAE